MFLINQKPRNKCFRPASTKKQPFLLKKMQKRLFLPCNGVFWPWVVTCSPPYPICRVLDSKRHVFYELQAS